MSTIKEKHQEIFEFLMAKHRQDPEFRFLLRRINKGDKLEKGYWFYGNNEYISLSFWEAWESKSAVNIDFTIWDSGKSEIILRGKDSSEKENILNKLSITLDGDQAIAQRKDNKGQSIAYWSKTLEGMDYLKNLDNFLTLDKPLIDSFLKRFDTENKLFPFVTEEAFNKAYINIKNWQNKNKTLKSVNANAVKLLALRIENIKRFTETYISLNKPIICFFGANGTGKTTLLRAITVAIAGEKNLDQSRKELKHLLKIKETTKEREIFIEKAKIELTYTVDEFNEEKPSFNNLVFIYKPINDSLEIQNEGEKSKKNKQTFNLYGEEHDIFKTLIIGFAQQGKKEVNNRSNRTVWHPNIDDIDSLIYDTPDSRFQEFVKWIADKLDPVKVASFEERANNRKQVNEIFEVITSITDDEMRLSEDSNASIIKNKSNKNGIPLALMSQGYQNVVGWVGFFIKRLWEFGQTEIPDANFMEFPAVCLIDEIDTYLHPEWQYRILSVLSEKFINVQFIITSHSPFVLSSVPPDKIALYELKENEKGEIKIEEETRSLYGAQMNDVAEEMGTTKRFKTIDDKMDNLFEKIYNNQLTQATIELEELKNLTQRDNDSEFVKANTLIKTKEVINQRSK